jgi:hypothetical protein
MFENSKEEHAKGIKGSIEQIIGTNTNLKRRKKTKVDHEKEKFEKIINQLDEMKAHSFIINSGLIDFTKYEDNFYDIIDVLLESLYGKEAFELIFFYLYDRVSPTGEIQELVDEEGNVVILQNTSDLWELIQKTKTIPNKK